MSRDTNLSTSFLLEYNDASTRFIGLDNSLITRVTYIANKICEVYGRSFENWYFLDGDDSGLGEGYGDFTLSCRQEFFGITLEVGYINVEEFSENIVLNNVEWELPGQIPIRWLTEDFEEELINGKELYDANHKKEIEEILSLNSIKAKLTPEEIAFLKLQGNHVER